MKPRFTELELQFPQPCMSDRMHSSREPWAWGFW